MIDRLSAWFTRNSVAANILMVVVLIAGFFSLRSMRIESFPKIPPNSVTITTLYPGATPEQVSSGVSQRIERVLEGMPGIKSISSFSDEGLSTVWVQKTPAFAIDRFQNAVQARVDGITTLPGSVERPVVERDEFSIEALIVQVYGETDTESLQQVARTVRSELLVHPEIKRITPFGFLPYEMRIEINQDRLNAFGLTLADVAVALDRASVEYQSGSIVSDGGTVRVRADETVGSYTDLAEIPVVAGAGGARVVLADVATVVDGFVEDGSGFARYQGTPAVGFQVFSSATGHLLEVSEAAHGVVHRLRPTLPAGIEIDVWAESSPYMVARLQLLASNAWQGLLIVFTILALFLNFRLAIWIAAGIPISLAGTIVIIGDRFLGHSLNDITTFGMIVVLGILVDDAIVVGESVFETRRTIRDRIEGTIAGVHRVSTATVFGAFTTISAFFPLLLIESDIGKVFAGFAVVVIVALLMSLAESKLILPAHLAAVPVDDRGSGPLARTYRRVRGAAQGALDWINSTLYRPALRNALEHRYAVVVAFVTVATVAGLLVANGWVRTVFFPEVPGQIITVDVRMRSGGPETLTEQNVFAIERAAERINTEAVASGETTKAPIARVMSAMEDPYSATVYAELLPEEHRTISTTETIDRWRDLVGTMEGVEHLSFSGTFETGGGFVVEIADRTDEILHAAVDEFVAALATYEGVSDVRSNAADGRPEIRLRLTREGHHLGLTNQDLAEAVGNAFGGLEVERVRRGSDEVKVKVTYAADRRRYVSDLLDTRIALPSGRSVRLAHVARVEGGFSPTTVYRRNGRRVVQVTAALDSAKVSGPELFAQIQRDITPEIATRYPSVTITGAGELEEMGDMQDGLRRALIMIVILIYAFLAIPLKSYTQPLVIMSVVPFGFVGAVVGHLLMGAPLSVLSFFGMLAVMGIVVNDSLVMLTRYNEMREEGVSVSEALVGAGGTRFRAILLTTMTTVLGLLPLLTETSEQAQYLVPAAISLAFGELVATPITLFIVPVLIRIKYDLSGLFRRRSGRASTGVRETRPA